MATGGVGSQFLAILGADGKAAGRRMATMLVVAVLLAVPAYFLLPWQGLLAHVLGVLAGLLAGNLWCRRKTATYEASLRGTWKSWMRWAVACESVPEVHRRVTGRNARNGPYLLAAVLTLLWATEVGLLLLAFKDTTATWVALPVILLNGFLPGALVAYYARLRVWVRELADSVADLVASGEIGVWGVL